MYRLRSIQSTGVDQWPSCGESVNRGRVVRCKGANRGYAHDGLTSDALCRARGAGVTGPHTGRFHLYAILEKTELHTQKTDPWFPGGWGGEQGAACKENVDFGSRG